MKIGFANGEIIFEGSFSGKGKTKRENKGKSLIEFPADFTIIDLETTGLDTRFCDIIEFAALKVRNYVVVDTFQSLVNINEPLDEFITELTGITDEMLKNSPDINSVLPEFLNFIGQDKLVGHNVNFDINFVYDAVQKYLNDSLTNNFIDTLRLCRRLYPSLKHHRLKDMTEYLNIETTQSHRALFDCEACLKVFTACQKEVNSQFPVIEDFYKTTKKSFNKYINVNDIKPQTDEIDESNPFFEQECVFTGALEKLSRKDAMQIVVNFGGTVKNSVTKKTNYLILGNLDFCKSIKDGKSSKHKRAEELKLKGQDIEIISEHTFYEMLETQ